MSDFLETGLAIVAFAVAVTALGFVVEMMRRSSLRKWARVEGGAFEAGSLLDGVAVPEAAAFDLGDEKVTYSNVSRFARDGISFVTTERQNRWRDNKGNWRSFSCVVGFVTLPGEAWPLVRVDVEAAKLEVRPAGVEPAVVARLLTPAVREELAGRAGLVSGLEVRGEVVRLQAVSRRFGHPHREVLELARRLVALWRR